MNELILVTGGARSGKSDFAERIAAEIGGDDVTFLATAEAHDEDMAQRIAAHRASRPAAWQTVEAPRELARAVERAEPAQVVLLDCLTLLTSNVLLAAGDEPNRERAQAAVVRELDALLGAVKATSATLIVVTNEVGLGLVPSTRLGRVYRDVLGAANRHLATAADRVYLMVSGLPLEVKSAAVAWPGVSAAGRSSGAGE